MTRKPLLATALLLACAMAPFALAQDAAAPPARNTQPAAMPMDGKTPMRGHPQQTDRGHDRMRAMRMQHMHGMHGMHGGDRGAAADLHALERLYRQAGRSGELTALYNEVLGKTQDPRLRTYVYHQLARQQMQPRNIDQAAATLRKSLNENLANEARQRAAAESMRQQWLQRQGTNQPSDK